MKMGMRMMRTDMVWKKREERSKKMNRKQKINTKQRRERQ